MSSLIFGDLPNYKVSVVEYPKLDYAFRGMAENLEKIIRFERRSSEVVKSDHPLLGILNSAGRMLDQDIRFHYLTALDLNDEWCAARGITTASKTASPYLGEFLGGADVEFVVSSIDRIPSNKFVNNSYADWESLTPVKVVSTNYHDSYPWLPGEAPEEGNQWAVISVDLPMLSIMYREWVKFVRKNDMPEHRASFIRNYVLANAIKSMQRAKMVTRLLRLRRGLDLTHIRGDNQVATVDYEGRLKKEQYKMVKDNATRDVDWIELMQNMQIDSDTTLLDMVEPIQAAETSQNRWVLAMAQVNLWKLLLSYDKVSGVNQQYRSRLKRFLYELERDRGVNGTRNYAAVALVKEEFEQLTKLCKER